MKSALARFNDKVVVNSNGCWVWQAQIDARGFGRFQADGCPELAHRFSFEMHRGRIPRDKVVRQRCGNRACVRPDHLELADPEPSALAQRNAAKERCIHGHALVGRNLYVRPDGSRECRACRAESQRRWRRKGE